MDDEDDIIEIWEISDKRLSWSPFESAFLISNFNHGAAMHRSWCLVSCTRRSRVSSSVLILGVCTEHALNIEKKEKTNEELNDLLCTEKNLFDKNTSFYELLHE
jgi:hypothetical protein